MELFGTFVLAAGFKINNISLITVSYCLHQSNQYSVARILAEVITGLQGE